MKAGGRGSADKQKGTSMYADDKYKIVGTISIPEEKREEFNRNVEKVLDVFGIRQTEKRMVGDREITVLKKPEADEDGIEGLIIPCSRRGSGKVTVITRKHVN